MFQKVQDAEFIRGEHSVLKFWEDRRIFERLREQNRGKKTWSFLDGPITANNPMGVHHAWGRTYKDAYQRYFAMTGHELRYQNGFDCQGLWVEVEVEKELGFGAKNAIESYGIDKFVNACKQRVLRFAARQTEQSIRLGYWMEWDRPDELRKLAENMGQTAEITFQTPRKEVRGPAHLLTARLGNPEWGGSYFTFSTENNETIWTFLKKCFLRGKIYKGHDVMPWSGRSGSAYSQMEVADGRRLTTHHSVFVRFPLRGRKNEFLLVWTTTPWTLTSNVVAAVNPDLDYLKLRANKDGALYYFAKDNLNFQRMEKEYKEGFGGEEMKWPKDVPKLKTLSQIFKEQGGYAEEGTVKGAEMIGWEYDGPFDELPAQQRPGGVPEDERHRNTTGVGSHRVIDGGRDNKGNANVVAGEGTGIVHMAPGCGDVDHRIAAELGILGIAPLGEDGRYMDGFGPFTGREAIDPATAEMVFESLRAKNLLVATERYPHIYPHCWRTGDELVFRLVDEWFINMDWREEIKEVTRQINWVPDSIDGEERELEWLTNMRDWMISKKRFWGLALPIWVDEKTGDFEVIGSLAELKQRAVAGWDVLEKNTPHRPWIDAVKIENPKTGNQMSRIRDVGNPWLDAGIVPFSTMQYNSNRPAWEKWYPADLVTECFPGQFRNWFYSLLSMATMMDNTPPFHTLLGHKLVMNEEGKAMHKSDGTAIWFEEAAEQLGVDTLRWLYLAQNPAQDLRFGTRHPEERVELPTPDGPITKTKEGLPTCKVTSAPADEVRRRILIPLWNSYAFFVNYAVSDEFDPQAPAVPVKDRPEIDRWILSNLQSLIQTAHNEFQAYNVMAFCEATARFLDDLSNWYIRRNRRRFWSKRGEGDPRDKQAAYQTLHTVLVTLCQLLAPAIPFLTERMYRNLVAGWDKSAPESVHLCAYPVFDQYLSDPELNERMSLAQSVVRLGHRLREEGSLRVRQPLAELQFAARTPEQLAAISRLTDVIRDELNVKKLTARENLDDVVRYEYKPNLKTLGPKFGKLLGAIRQQLPTLDPTLLDPLRSGQSVTVTIGGESVVLQPDDVMVNTTQAADWLAASDGAVQVALSTQLTPELTREGMARDFVRQVQELRKQADLDINDRIAIHYASSDAELATALKEWGDYIQNETQADRLTPGESPAEVAKANVGSLKVPLWIVKK